MRVGSHRAQRGGISWPVLGSVVGILAVAAAAAWFFFLREGAPVAFGDDEFPVADFSFDFGKVGGLPIEVGAKLGQDDLVDSAENVRETLDALYTAAFVDPDKWEEGEFPEVPDYFGGDAAEHVEADLGSLTLGGDAPHVAFVEPHTGRLNIRFLVDEEQTPVAAIANAHFGAEGELKDGRPLGVVHDGTYYMEKVDGRWLIVGYDVGGAVQPGGFQEPGVEGSP